MHSTKWGLLLNIVLFSISSVLSAGPKVYTYQEKEALKIFRNEVIDILYRPYMKEDKYLINWLKNKNFNIPGAVAKIRNAHQWRKANRIDTILEDKEPWTEISKILPYRADGISKDGYPSKEKFTIRPSPIRSVLTITITNKVFWYPVIEFLVSKWDTRKFLIKKGAEADQYNLFVNRIFEEMFTKIGKQNEKNPNVTQGIGLWDFSGYNMKQHGCLACIPRQVQVISDYEAYYPQQLKHAFLVNTPKIFEQLYSLMRAVMSEETKELVKVYGLNKAEWSIDILKLISPDQISRIFGGNRPSVPTFQWN